MKRAAGTALSVIVVLFDHHESLRNHRDTSTLEKYQEGRRAHMISRSDWEPLPMPTLSPFAPGYLSLCRFSLPLCGVCLLCGCRWFIL